LEDIYDGFFPKKLKGKYFSCTPIFLLDETNKIFVPKAKMSSKELDSMSNGLKAGSLERKLSEKGKLKKQITLLNELQTPRGTRF